MRHIAGTKIVDLAWVKSFSAVWTPVFRQFGMPELHAKVHEEYRRALVRRFPYAIFYEYTGGKVTVYCIFHASRDPKKWRNRLV